MNEGMAERIAQALADRRPVPSTDFEARLERACEPARLSHLTGLLAAAAVACAMLVVVVTHPGPGSRPAPSEWHERPQGPRPPSATPATKLPHDGKFSVDQCTTCHTDAAPRPPALHEPKGSFPLDGDHRTVPCAACHAANKPPQPACSSCHPPGRGKLTE
jgi:hypothetical protein